MNLKSLRANFISRFLWFSKFLGELLTNQINIDFCAYRIQFRVLKKTNRQRWDSNPRKQNVWDQQSTTLTSRQPCLTRVYSMIKWIETKKKWSKDASLQIEIFFAQNKKPVKSNHYSIKDRLEVCVFERYWRIKLSSPRTRLVQVVFQTKSFRWNFKFFEATC